MIDHQHGGGGTELLPALRNALALPRAEGVARTVVIATDGYVTVESEAFDLIRGHLGDATMIPFGIGSSVNRHLIEGLARVGMGEPFVVTDPAKAKHAAAAFRKLIATPVATHITIDYGEFDAYDVEPPAVPDLLAERPVIVFGKYRGTPRGRIRVTGTTGSAPSRKSSTPGRAPLRTTAPCATSGRATGLRCCRITTAWGKMMPAREKSPNWGWPTTC